ncbi:flagellar hook-length control protein FliK [Tabrizicola sp.]|uniref:flagellar hook-length control protein FliK n=1 Tax=Tabrizicola sp. TaxID=2005166 RepID=UPI002FDE1310
MPEDAYGRAFGDVVAPETGDDGPDQTDAICAAASGLVPPAWLAIVRTAGGVEACEAPPVVAFGRADAAGLTDAAGPADLPAMTVEPEAADRRPAPPQAVMVAMEGQSGTSRGEIFADRGADHPDDAAEGPLATLPSPKDRPMAGAVLVPFDANSTGEGRMDVAEAATLLPQGLEIGLSSRSSAAMARGNVAVPPMVSPVGREVEATLPAPVGMAKGDETIPWAAPAIARDVRSEPAAASLLAALDVPREPESSRRSATPEAGGADAGDGPPEAAAPLKGREAGWPTPGKSGSVAPATGTTVAAGETAASPDNRRAEAIPDAPSQPKAQARSAPLAPAPDLEDDADGATPADREPENGDLPALVPGVWERLFTGVIAPVMWPSDDPVTLAPLLPSAGARPVGEGVQAANSEAAKPRGDAADLPTDTEPQTAVISPPKRLPPPATGLLQQAADLASADDHQSEELVVVGLPGLAAGRPGNPGAPATVPGPGPATLPAPQIAHQIGSALSHAADGSTELALSPDELGKVRLKLKPDAIHPDRMVVMITFERPETLELFRRHAGELADALRSAGYAGADIGFGQEGSFASGEGRQGPAPSPEPDSPPRPRAADTTPTPARALAGDSLDLRL